MKYLECISKIKVGSSRLLIELELGMTRYQMFIDKYGDEFEGVIDIKNDDKENLRLAQLHFHFHIKKEIFERRNIFSSSNILRRYSLYEANHETLCNDENIGLRRIIVYYAKYLCDLESTVDLETYKEDTTFIYQETESNVKHELEDEHKPKYKYQLAYDNFKIMLKKDTTETIIGYLGLKELETIRSRLWPG